MDRHDLWVDTEVGHRRRTGKTRSVHVAVTASGANRKRGIGVLPVVLMGRRPYYLASVKSGEEHHWTASPGTPTSEPPDRPDFLAVNEHGMAVESISKRHPSKNGCHAVNIRCPLVHHPAPIGREVAPTIRRRKPNRSAPTAVIELVMRPRLTATT